jgi:hypothetical protein
VASPLTTVILREKTVRDARVQAREVLPGALDRAIEQLRETVTEVVTRHGAALDEHLQLADRALAEQLLDSLRGASLRLSAHEARIAAALASARPAEAKPAEPSEAPSWDAEAPAPQTDHERLRERVSAAAQAELGGLERQLETIVGELSRMTFDDQLTEDDQTEPELPPVIH